MRGKNVFYILICFLVILLGGCNLFPKPQVTLQVEIQGEGDVYPNQGVFDRDSVVTLSAVPKTDWKFAHWSGGATGTQPNTTLIMDSDKVVVATFVQINPIYTVNITIEGQGEVIQTLIENAKGTYIQGDMVQLEALPAEGWVFQEWSGDLMGNTNPLLLTVEQSYNITAVFTEKQTPTEAKWNFLVYLDADNNLESFGIVDINEMERIGSSSDINILVLIDRHPGYDTSNGNWTGTRLYRISKDSQDSSDFVSEMLFDYGEKDMSDPTTLSDFIIYCQTHYPAERTILTLWDHGGGVAPKTGFLVSKKNPVSKTTSNKMIAPQGICWDDTTGTDAWSCLTTDEVALALSTARAVTQQKIDVLNLDACLMQMIEVMYEWRQECAYIVGSEETVPGSGNDYGAILALLAQNPSMTSEELARILVDSYYNYYSINGQGKETYSALTLDANFETLIGAFQTLATTLKNTSDMSGVYNAWINTMWFTSNEYNDLYSFTMELINKSSDSAVRGAAITVQQALNQVIIYHKETSVYQGNVYGLSVLIPSAVEWENYSDLNQYVSLKLSLDSDWDDFILKFVNYTAQ